MRGTQFRTTNLASNFGFSPEFVKEKMKRRRGDDDGKQNASFGWRPFWTFACFLALL